MQKDYHHWISPRLGREVGVGVFGHYGPPLLAFPTSGGDEREHERQSMIGALADSLESHGR